MLEFLDKKDLSSPENEVLLDKVPSFRPWEGLDNLKRFWRDGTIHTALALPLTSYQTVRVHGHSH
jgi:hypothetical protein